MKRKLHAVVLLALAVLLSGCGFGGVYDLPLPGKVVDGQDSFEVRADFADALNVVPRTAVMVADVPVGQVESVSRVGWKARVTMRVRKDVDLPDDARAQIRQTSLLGEKFIELAAPEKSTSTGRLGDGDVIGMDRTGLNPEVEDVLGALSMLLTGGGIGQLQTITHELNAMMNGRTGEMKSLLKRLETFTGTIDGQRDDIIAAMESIDGLSATLVSEKGTIDTALKRIGPAVDVLRDQHTELVKMLTELDKLGTVGTRVIDETKDDLVAELRHLEPVLRELANTGDALVPGAVAAASYPFPIDAARAIHGDFANVIFSMQIKLKPVSEGGLLPTTLQDLETLCKGLPTAPLCAPAGDAIDQLCSLLGSLPLCRQSDAAGPGLTSGITGLGAGEETRQEPGASPPDESKASSDGTSDPSPQPNWLSGWLKGVLG